MSPWLIPLHMALALTAFLVAFNGYLRGSLKYHIHSALVVGSIGLMLLGLFFGWKALLASVTLYFIYYALTKPLARALAWRWLGHRTTFVDWPSADPIQEVLMGKMDPPQMFQALKEKKERERTELGQLVQTPSIADVLARNGLSFDEFCELYRWLNVVNLGQELRWGVISDPAKLQELIDMRSACATRDDCIRIHTHFTQV